MANENDRLDRAREQVLDRMESGRKVMNFALGAATVLELGMLVACILLVDWSNGTQVLLFIIFILSYFILALGMVALAGHVSQSAGRILAVLEAQRDERR